jgi:hypothetical protein
MKPIAAILRSYLHRRFILFILIPSVFNFIAAHALSIERGYPGSWGLFLFSLTGMAMVVGYHLLETSTIDLLPKHRPYQLVTSGLLLALFLVWPTILMALRGGPVLVILAIYLFFACLSLWIVFHTFAAYGLVLILGFPTMIWLLSDQFQKGNLPPESTRIARFGIDHLGSSWPIYMIVASLLGLFYFAHYYMRAARVDSPDESGNDYLECHKTQDSTDNLSSGIASNAISRLAGVNSVGKASFLRLVRLFQFSLFSPMFGMHFFSCIFVLFATYLSFHGRVPLPGMNIFLPMAYYFCPAAAAMTFLNHRNRMPFIYLSSCLPSRNSFLRATVLSYLLVVLKQTIFMTLTAVLAHAIFPWTSWTCFPQLCTLGFILSFIQVSFSLLASKRIKSANALSWLLINMVLIAPIPLFARLCSRTWTVSLVLTALFSGFLFWLAMRKWQKTELDFAAS